MPRVRWLDRGRSPSPETQKGLILEVLLRMGFGDRLLQQRPDNGQQDQDLFQSRM